LTAAEQLAADLQVLRLDQLPPRPGALAQAICAAWPQAGHERPLLAGWGWPQVRAFQRVLSLVAAAQAAGPRVIPPRAAAAGRGS
jgi:hypothetical protein